MVSFQEIVEKAKQSPEYKKAGFEIEFKEEIIKESIAAFLDEVEEIAEKNMMKTGKLEGAHYAAMKLLRKKYGLPKRKLKRQNNL